MKFIRILEIVFIWIVVVLVSGYAGFLWAYKGLVYPRLLVGGIEVGGLSKEQVKLVLGDYFKKHPNLTKIRNDGLDILSTEGIKVNYDFEWVADQAILQGRSGNILTRLSDQWRLFSNKGQISVPITYDEDEVMGLVEEVDSKLSVLPVWPKLVDDKGEVKLTEAVDGRQVDKNELKTQLVSILALPGEQVVEVPVETVMTQPQKEVLTRAIEKAQIKKSHELWLVYDGIKTLVSPEVILSLYPIREETINNYYWEENYLKWKEIFEKESQNAIFGFDGEKVTDFAPEVVGVKINEEELKNLVKEWLFSESDQVEVVVPIELYQPQITVGMINDLGIKELIGRGTSEFAHSIPSRVFNVNLAGSRVNGVLVPPGEEFSFNGSVGEISRATGYQSAYVISGGRTVLGDGGGVCQVSTTVFRAALSSGLPITARKAHAYRVGYYEQDSGPGIDATVYSPSVDLKFLNDTGHYILIQTKVDTKNLKMEVNFYGTKDGRVSFVSEPKVWGQTPPPATMYVDDPTLAKGVLKQIDWSAWGAKTSFDYKVTRDGQTLIEKTFYSNFQPWQAIYLRGTAD